PPGRAAAASAVTASAVPPSSSHPLGVQPAPAPASGGEAAATPAPFSNVKRPPAVTAEPKRPTRTWYVYVPGGAAAGTGCRTVRTRVPPGGRATFFGPRTSGRLIGPVTAVHAWIVCGWAVTFVRVTVNSKAPPVGGMTTGGLTGAASTVTDASALSFATNTSARPALVRVCGPNVAVPVKLPVK